MRVVFIISYFVFPFILTFSSFWTYVRVRELKNSGVRVSPFLWAFLVWGVFVFMFPLFLLLKYTKWKKEIVESKPPSKLTQWQRILAIVLFFAVYIFTLFAVVELSGWLSFRLGFREGPYLEIPKEYIKKTEVPPEDETANWEIYRNDEYGFEIKYPLNSKVEIFYEDPNFNLESIPEPKKLRVWDGIKRINKDFERYLIIKIYENVYNSDDGLSKENFESWLKLAICEYFHKYEPSKEVSCFDISSMDEYFDNLYEIEINNAKSFWMEETYSLDHRQRHYFFINSGNIYEIIIPFDYAIDEPTAYLTCSECEENSAELGSESLKVFNQILSTFRFLE